MLYQPKTRTSRRNARPARSRRASTGRSPASLAPTSDGAYLDGMRNSELEDLGLRRRDDGGYGMFK